MNFFEIIKEALEGLKANKVRSGLTMLGIIIGIGAVIALISLGQGSQASIKERIQSIGSNLIIISPGFQGGMGGVRSARGGAITLSYDDAQAIVENVPNVANIAPEFSQRYQIVYKASNTNTTVIGVTPEYPEVRNIELQFGSFISSRNLPILSKVAVLGPTTAEDLFGTTNPIGQKIKINRISFTVIGVTKSKGQTGFFNQDDRVFVPLTTAQKILARADYVSSIAVQAQSEDVMSLIQANISTLLLQRHNISNPQEADFSVMNQADLVEAVSEITNVFTILLASIAGISLLVGGIGIMNMMLTAVTERTREIGLRKAIGAKRKDITFQFILEAVILTFLGGGIGIILGALLGFGISHFAGINTQISFFAVLLAFSVSTAIGLIFGYYPARRAAKLNPIEALRYE